MPGYGKQCAVVCVLALSVGMLSGCANSPSPSSTVTITPTSALLSPGQKLQFTASVNLPNAPQFFRWQVNGIVGGSAATGTITTDGVYTAPNTPTTQPMKIGVREQPAVATVSIFDPKHPNPGSVAATQNPLVATYTMPILPGASVQVQFGTDTTYGFSTSMSPAPVAGGPVTVLVAGMRASTTYHMQAVVEMSDGSQYADADHTFTTGAIPADMLPPNITTQLTGVGSPSPGIELLSLALENTGPQNLLCAVATDLAGNVVWYYALPVGASATPIKLLPNGHMLLLTAGTVNDIREIDLAGNLVHQITLGEINASLAQVASFQVTELSHDVLSLPNGHFVLLADYSETINDAPGVPAGTVVAGNALIDWDLQKGAVWTWSVFDHLSFSHAPFGLADWTHANAVIYSPDDGDLIFSMRDQDWIIKINYQDGAGDGSIVWRFGPDGDFTLPSPQAPIEWNYGQHYPIILSPNSSGIFSMMFFNNGNGRLLDSNNDSCGFPGFAACYSSVPIFQVDEYNKTASVVWEDNLIGVFSECCGDALVLSNGDAEFDVADDIELNTTGESYIEEVTQTPSPELVWKMIIKGQLAYRGLRIPSLYPGQVWPANTQQNVRPADDSSYK
jgi:arylsulfate sulfotransferase